MYLKGTISINLKGTQVEMNPPKNFFGGVANLITGKKWSTPEEHETFKIMALAQAIYRILRDMGVNNVARIALGDVVIYEYLEDQPDDFPLAMETLQKKVDSGLELGHLKKFDLILRYDDGVLSYVIDFDIFHEHRPGVDPITIRITALSSELRRDKNESEDEYTGRVKSRFANQADFNRFKGELEEQFQAFLDGICQKFNDKLGIEEIDVDKCTRLIRKEKDGEARHDWALYSGYGCAFYAFDPLWDLYYLSIWSSLFYDQELAVEQFEYVDPDGAVLAAIDDAAWTVDDFETFEVSDSGGGEALEAAAEASDSGGGGWLDSVSDLFSSDSDGGSDSGGGGDTGDSGSSCSSCGGCSGA